MGYLHNHIFYVAYNFRPAKNVQGHYQNPFTLQHNTKLQYKILRGKIIS